jgi:hypothetical protein
MPRKKLGHKGVVKLDGTAIGCIRGFTPAEKSRDEVDVTCFGDAIMEYLDADPPDQGVFKLDVVWEPGDTNSQLIDTLFDDTDPDDREGAFSIEWAMFDPLVTDSFSGRILKITPAEVKQKELIARSIELRLTTAITRVVDTP